MNRKALLTIALASFLAAPLMVQAMTPGSRDAGKPVGAEPAIVKAVAATPAKAAEPACARKVKVVYAGYGEGAGRPCEAQAAK
jgi:hypothetical protein